MIPATGILVYAYFALLVGAVLVVLGGVCSELFGRTSARAQTPAVSLSSEKTSPPTAKNDDGLFRVGDPGQGDVCSVAEVHTLPVQASERAPVSQSVAAPDVNERDTTKEFVQDGSVPLAFSPIFISPGQPPISVDIGLRERIDARPSRARDFPAKKRKRPVTTRKLASQPTPVTDSRPSVELANKSESTLIFGILSIVLGWTVIVPIVGGCSFYGTWTLAHKDESPIPIKAFLGLVLTALFGITQASVVLAHLAR